MSKKTHSQQICDMTSHRWKEEYYGWVCEECKEFIPYGCEPWMPDEISSRELEYDENSELIPCEIHFVEQPKSNGLSAIIDLLNQEIEWCENNRGISGKGEGFERGFLGGLGQAVYLVEQAKRVMAGLPPSNIRSHRTGRGFSRQFGSDPEEFTTPE